MQFRTPRGQTVEMEVREGTNDYNVLNSCLNEDEYGLRDLHLEGWALDIGAYIGGVTVALAADNPGLRVVAVEPVPDNVEVLRRNLERNALADRVAVLEAAAGDGSEVNIRYGYSGTELAEHHRYIGNLSLIGEPGPDLPHTVRRMTSLSISGIRLAAFAFRFAKIDCEGCEWDVDLSMVPRIHGEWHPVRGHTREEWFARLGETHEVTFTGPVAGPGGFVAVAR